MGSVVRISVGREAPGDMGFRDIYASDDVCLLARANDRLLSFHNAKGIAAIERPHTVWIFEEDGAFRARYQVQGGEVIKLRGPGGNGVVAAKPRYGAP